MITTNDFSSFNLYILLLVKNTKIFHNDSKLTKIKLLIAYYNSNIFYLHFYRLENDQLIHIFMSLYNIYLQFKIINLKFQYINIIDNCYKTMNNKYFLI